MAMSIAPHPLDKTYTVGRQLYVRPPNPVVFPSEEEVPETKRHLEARTLLYLLLKEGVSNAAIGSEQFVYWDPTTAQKRLAPDVFVKLGQADDAFDNWKVWERGAPELAVEIVSSTDQRESDWDDKLARYQASGVREVVRFDPIGAAKTKPDPILRVWDRVDGDLVERSQKSPALRECVALSLFWIVLPSAAGPMLRLARDPEGKSLLPTPAEDRLSWAEEAARLRRERTEAEHARLEAEQARIAAEKKAQLAAEAQAAAEHKTRLAAEAQAAAEAEVKRLLAELARLKER